MPLPPVGSIAPDFTLPSTSGGSVTLSALRGQKVLLAFFPLAFTSVCTAELCAFSEDYDQFAQHDTVVLPISVDAIPSLRAFRTHAGLSVHLLSDFRREACREYGTLLEDAYFSRRAYVIVGRDGRVEWTWAEDDLDHRRENRELLERLAAA